MRFFLDNCVPHSVGRVLEAGGHEVIYQREVLAADAADTLVALGSVENDAVLISFDKDFREIASRRKISKRGLRKLSRIHLRCREPRAAERISKALSLIEAEWKLAQQAPDSRMFIELQENAIKTLR